MTKIKKSQTVSQNHPKKHSKKGGSINKKKKQEKYKNTPSGKVALINSNNKPINIDRSPQNGRSKTPQKNSKNSQNGKTAEKLPKNGKSPSKKTSPESKIDLEEDEDDSSSDINEGVSINEIFSGQEDDADSSSSDDEDVTMPDIFGNSLAEETDEDDDEFAEKENKGIRMFKGLKKPETEDSSEEDENEEDEDSEDEEEEDDKNVLGLESLLGASIADESDDEDFKSAEESDDSDDMTDDDEENEEVPSVNSSVLTSGTENDESDESEDDEDDDDDEDSDDDIGQLLGDTIPDNEDDADFDGEQEDDEEDDEATSEDEINNESFDSANSDKKIKPGLTKEEIEDREKRTIFIGNVPKEIDLPKIAKEFKKFGPIENLRIRGIIPRDLKTPLKVAAIKKDYHPLSKTVCVFLTFQNIESVEKAITMNGKKFHGNYLRVDVANYDKNRQKENTKKTVFLGNLPFAIEDNELWEMFKDCGSIESVRIIRDRETGVGRGFGFINFQTTDGAVLALDLNGTSIQNRELRVQVDTPNAAKKKQTEKSKKRKHEREEKSGSPKKFKTENSESLKVATHNSVNAERRKDKRKHSQGAKQRVKSESSSPQSKNVGKFQGQKADSKKKSKPDKTAKRKKQMAAKLLVKPKKSPVN